jgi:hypothetical protein
MNAMLKSTKRIIAVLRSCRWSVGSLLATAINVAVCGVVTYLVEGGLSSDHAGTAGSAPILEPHVWPNALGMIALILAVLAASTHGQKILAACLDVLAEALLDSRRASSQLGVSVDRLLTAVRRFLGFGNEKKPLGRRPPPRKRSRVRRERRP